MSSTVGVKRLNRRHQKEYVEFVKNTPFTSNTTDEEKMIEFLKMKKEESRRKHAEWCRQYRENMKLKEKNDKSEESELIREQKRKATAERLRKNRLRRKLEKRKAKLDSLKNKPMSNPMADKLESNKERTRNVLTLKERVEVIRAYESCPIFSKIAKKYYCSCKQIRAIIANRDSIMQKYEAEQILLGTTNELDENDVQMKIKFLGKCVYEYLQRFLFYYPKVEITEESICAEAREFCDAIEIEKFVPDSAWIAHFKNTYHIESFAELYLDPNRVPPNILKCKEILEYCKPMISNDTRTTIGQGEWKTLEPEQDRKYKIDLLERSLYKYAKRAKALMGMNSSQEVLRKVALRLKEILMIDSLFLDKVWFRRFCDNYNITVATDPRHVMQKQPLLVDLHEIINYCGNSAKDTNRSASKSPIPDTSSSLDHSPLIKIKNEVLNSDGDDDNDEEFLTLSSSDSPSDLAKNFEFDSGSQSSLFKIDKVEPSSEDESSVSHSPAQNGDKIMDDDEPLPKTVENYEDALKLLEPLEKFVMLEGHFCVVGLISQLKTIFENSSRPN